MESAVRKYTSQYKNVFRAKIVLMASQGLNNDEIADRLDTSRQIVNNWRKRFYEEGLHGLQDLSRGDRPGSFQTAVIVEIKALACEIPDEIGLPLSRFSISDLRREAINRGIVAQVSGTTLWRWLAKDAIKS